MPATRGSKKDSDRAVTPAMEAVPVPTHLELSGPSKPSSCTPSHSALTGAELPQAKKKKNQSLASMCTRSLRSCLTLCDSVDWPARLLYQGGGSPGENTGACWPILLPYPLEHCISCCPSLKPKSSRAASRAKPQCTTHT